MHPICTLAKKYKNHPVHNYLVAEKYNGIRAVWNGKNFISRQNKKIGVPGWFKKGMPQAELDGELFLWNDGFNDLLSLVKTKNKRADLWQCVNYMVFDTMDDRVIDAPIEERIGFIEELQLPMWCYKVKYFELNTYQEMISALDNIIAEKGEGLVLRERFSLYEFNRTSAFLKLKPHYL
jgi:DNA ligase-1